MQSGKFDTRVTFEEKVKIPNGGGGHNVEWREMQGASNGSRWAAVWAIKQNKGDEDVTASSVENAPDYRLIVRPDPGTEMVRANWRVMIGGVAYAIKSLTRPDRQANTITMIIQEGQPT